MRAIIMPDSFKGTMSSAEICRIFEEKLTQRGHHALCLPVADGGEGTVEAMLTAVGGQRVTLRVTGPRFQPVEGFYGILPDGTAVVEMAAAAGLPLMGDTPDATVTTTYGVGELLADAVGRGCRRIILGLGGSATNDGGCGAAAALGVRFFDKEGQPFIPVGGTLERIARIERDGDPLQGVELIAMCDIDNPLTGERGAAAVFGPQKGASPQQVALLDAGLAHVASLMRRDLGADVEALAGAGAAGGLGGGAAAFFGARLQSGIQTVLDTVEFEKKLEQADVVFTGEGRIDAQSMGGKVVIGIARRAKAKGVPVIAVVGDAADGVDAPAYENGVTAVFTINRLAIPFSQAKSRAAADMAATVENLIRALELKL